MLKKNKSMMKKTVLGAVIAMCCTQALAADYADGNIRKNDFNWMQMNLMQSVDAKVPYGIRNDTYLELEFGARSGIIDLYGYVDFFDILDREQDDRHGGDNFFAKISPRFSLDAIFNKDLSVGPFNEFYIATVNNIGDRELFEHYVGLGTDVKVPWFGLVGMNIYAHYVRENYGADNEGKWDGYMFSTNWSTPFYTFANLGCWFSASSRRSQLHTATVSGSSATISSWQRYPVKNSISPNSCSSHSIAPTWKRRPFSAL